MLTEFITYSSSKIIAETYQIHSDTLRKTARLMEIEGATDLSNSVRIWADHYAARAEKAAQNDD